jgi:hypothetical protein
VPTVTNRYLNIFLRAWFWSWTKYSLTYPGVMNIAELETNVGVPRAQGVVQPRGHKARQRSVWQCAVSMVCWGSKWFFVGIRIRVLSSCRIRILFRIQQDFFNTYIASFKVKLRVLVVLKIKKIISDPGLSRSWWEMIYTDPGLFLPLDPESESGPGWEKIRIRDKHPRLFFRELRNSF